jgi:PKD repeat protein
MASQLLKLLARRGTSPPPAPSVPAVDFVADDTTPTDAQSVQFTSFISGYPPPTRAWEKRLDGGSYVAFDGTPTARHPDELFDEAGVWDVKLTVSNSEGTVSEEKLAYLTVTAAPVAPVAAFSADDTTPAVGATVTFTDESTNTPTSWLWEKDVGAGFVTFSTAQNPTLLVSAAGNVGIRLTATNAAGSDAETKTGYLEVTEQPAPTLQYALTRSPHGVDGLRLTFADDVDHVAVPTLTASGGAVAATYSAGTGTRVLDYTLSRAVSPTEVVTVGLAAGAVTAVTGGAGNEAVAAFDALPLLETHHHLEFAARLGAALLRSNGTGGGDWSDTATWVGGAVPTSASDVCIEDGDTVTVDDQTAAARSVLVYTGGKLAFDPAADTRLTTRLVAVYDDGEFEMGTAASPVAADKTAVLRFADVALPAQQLDPHQQWNGLIVSDDATVTIHGAVKATEQEDLLLSVEPEEGHDTFTLAAAPTGWRVGDKVVVPGTEPINFWAGDGSTQDVEERVITDVTGAVVTVDDPLDWDHLGAKNAAGVVDTFPHLLNLTRNAVIESENPAGVRGHTMFSGRAAVLVRYLLCSELGRTENQASLVTGKTVTDDTTLAANGLVTHAGTNQKGRYPLHVHHLPGPAAPVHTEGADDFQFVIEGCAVDGGRKWPLAVHRSHYGLIRGNTLYNATHAGMAFEEGNESYHHVKQNVVCRVIASGDHTICDGYWGLGAGFNTVEDNAGATCGQPNTGNGAAYQGHVFHLLDGLQRGGERPNGNDPDRFPLAPGVDIDADDATEGVDYELLNPTTEVDFTSFARNVGYGTTKGFSRDHHSVPNLATTDCVWWSCYKEAFFHYGEGGAAVQETVDTNVKVRRTVEHAYGVNTMGGRSTHRLVAPDIQQHTSYGAAPGVAWLGGVAGIPEFVVEGGTVAADPPVLMTFPNLETEHPDLPGTPPDKRFTLRGVTLENSGGGATLVGLDYTESGASPRHPCRAVTFVVEDHQGAAGDDYRLYWDEQDPAASCPFEDGVTVLYGATVAGRTNQQEFDDSGRSVGAALTPVTATAVAWVSGGVADDTSTAPQFSPSRYGLVIAAAPVGT